MPHFPRAVGSFWNIYPSISATLGGSQCTPGAPWWPWLLHGEEQGSRIGGRGSRPRPFHLLLLLLLYPIRRKWHSDAVPQDVLVLHALAGAFSCLCTGKSEYSGATRHTQHFPTTVIGQALKPATDGLGVAVRGEVVHKEEVETRLGSKERGSTLGFLGPYFWGSYWFWDIEGVFRLIP